LSDESVLSKISPELVLQSVRIELHNLVESLPPRNYLLLRYVILYLGNVLAYSSGILKNKQTNKQTIKERKKFPNQSNQQQPKSK